MDIQRIILIGVFLFSAFLLWQAWEREHQLAVSPIAGAPTEFPQARNLGPGASAALPARSVAPPGGPGAQTAAAVGEQIRIQTDLVEAVINTQGGVIDELDLLKHRSTLDNSKPYLLFENDTQRLFLAETGLLGKDVSLPNHDTLYTADPGPRTLAPDADTLAVVLRATNAQGVQVTQTITFHRGSYLIDVAYAVLNRSKTPLATDAYYQLVRDGTPPSGQRSMVPAYTGAAVYSEQDKFRKVPFSDIDKGKVAYVQDTDNGWVAMLEHYFCAAWVPSEAAKLSREFYTKRLPDRPNGVAVYAAGVIVPIGVIAPGQSGSVSVSLYAGPEEQQRLAQIAKGLELTVDYGIFTVIAAPLFVLLRWLHGLLGNWGWAIVLLTVLIKGVFYPLNAASARSMAKLKLVAPKMKAMQEQYANDKPKLQQAMMELYKTEKINPLGGCLPILVQMPVFLALYWVLLGAVELRHAPWIGWIQDLSAADPYYVLPVLYAISAFLQVKLNPTPSADPAQQRMMQIMPIAFSVMFIFFPAGLVLYWLVNNLLSIAQQWRMNSVLTREAAQAQARRR